MKRTTKGPSIGFKHALETHLVRKIRSLWAENESLSKKEMDLIFLTALLVFEVMECDLEKIRSEAKQIDADLQSERDRERENNGRCSQRADES